MDTKTLGFIALAVTILYGVAFAVIPDDFRQTWAIVGGVVVALVWIAVGTFGRDRSD